MNAAETIDVVRPKELIKFHILKYLTDSCKFFLNALNLKFTVNIEGLQEDT